VCVAIARGYVSRSENPKSRQFRCTVCRAVISVSVHVSVQMFDEQHQTTDQHQTA
jgi:hypothetical protein